MTGRERTSSPAAPEGEVASSTRRLVERRRSGLQPGGRDRRERQHDPGVDRGRSRRAVRADRRLRRLDRRHGGAGAGGSRRRRPRHPLRPESRQGLRDQGRGARGPRTLHRATSTPTSISTRPGCRSSSAPRERENLDFAIGSKRHPDSDVHYPRSRRIASWLYQQLVRVLFRLDVRDTQVGLKVFRREVAEQVLPLLLVKRFAFDLELLAVSRALGFGRIRELPIRLDYRFTGSGVRSLGRVCARSSTRPPSSTGCGFSATTSGSGRSPGRTAGRGRAATSRSSRS